MRSPASRSIAGLLALGAGLFLLSVSTVSPARAAAPLAVSARDLSTAGFTSPSIQPVSGSRFALPGTTYFRVKESVAAAHPEWAAEGDADLVAVTITPITWRQDAITGGTDQIKDLSGRAKICNSRPGYYFCIVGPDKAKEESLTNLLKTESL